MSSQSFAEPGSYNQVYKLCLVDGTEVVLMQDDITLLWRMLPVQFIVSDLQIITKIDVSEVFFFFFFHKSC